MSVFSSRVIRGVKHAALSVASRSRLSGTLGGSSWRQQRLLILCYHGVSKFDEHEWSDLYISPERLRSRLQLIRDSKCAVLSMSDAVQRLYAGTLPRRSVTLTFDDGAHDFLTRAYPLLREFGMPATLYVTSRYTTCPYPVFEPMTSYLLWKARGRSADLTSLIASLGTRVVPIDERERAALHQVLSNHASTHQLDPAARQDFIEQLARALGLDLSPLMAERVLQLLHADEMAQLDPALVDLQLHTHHHHIPQDPHEFVRSLDENKRLLEAARSPANDGSWHFCYPSGIYFPAAVQALEEYGIVSGATCDLGLATRRHPPLLLPRICDTMTMSEGTFVAWLQGVAEFMPRRRSG